MPGTVDETIELLQQLIRNRCVNDGSAASGHERRSVDVIEGYLEGPGIDVQRHEPLPGRASLVARIDGTDPTAPTLCLLGHTDVVPVHEERWEHDPFGGEVVADADGTPYVWGRGAIDMLNLTSSMAVAMRRIARSDFRPRGTLVYIAVADEEAGGMHGAEHLSLHEADAVRTDFLITESGGFPLEAAGGDIRLPVLVAEKGTLWSTLRVHGTPSHGSMPFRTDNALVKAGEIARRIADHRPPPRIDAAWRRFVDSLGFPAEMTAPLTDEESFNGVCELLPVGLSRVAWSCTHTTIAPTMMSAGTKLNIIPGEVELTLDIRTLPGHGLAEVEALLDDALGDLRDSVELVPGREIPATESPTDTALWDSLTRVVERFYAGSSLVPMLMTGATDARHFRRNLGTTSYGFGLFSRRLSMDELASMGHGDNERVDLESLHMVTDMWDALIRDLLG